MSIEQTDLPVASGDPALAFLSGGGEMGALIRQYNWSASPLGPPAAWPQSLKTAVRLLLSTGHPMFIWWGPDLIQFYNDAYRRSIGPERHPSAIGERGRECWAEIWHLIGHQIEQVMSGGGHTWDVNRLVPITRHGVKEDVYWTYSYSPIDDATAPNGIGGILVVCTETTEQVLSERRIEADRAWWRGLFDQAPSFMCILGGPEHRFEFANPRYIELIGNRDVIGKNIREALPEVTDQGFVELLDSVYRSGEVYTGLTVPIVLARPGGLDERVFLDFVYQPIRDASGAVVGIFVEGYDVTERSRATQALLEQDRRKDEFLAMLAHELRTPLAPIRNASELLNRLPSLPSQVRSIGDLLARQVTQLTRLVDDLLDISRITQGKIELQREAVDMSHAISLATESVRPMMATKNQNLSTRIEEHDLFVDGDPARLVQCIANVLTNAVKYNDVGGQIEVVLRREGRVAVVEITDNGVGIAPEMLPTVFDLFVQADRTLDRSQGGLGIGLSVVARLIEMHGGEVSAHSDGLGSGSTFRLRLPMIDKPTAKRSERPVIGRPRRILVVDDNPDSANSLSQLLGLLGHEAIAVYGPLDAIERVKTFEPEIVFLDIGLPVMDGYAVARHLRAQGSTSLLVAVTGYGQDEDVRRAREMGFDAHLTKPVEISALEAVLA